MCVCLVNASKYLVSRVNSSLFHSTLTSTHRPRFFPFLPRAAFSIIHSPPYHLRTICFCFPLVLFVMIYEIIVKVFHTTGITDRRLLLTQDQNRKRFAVGYGSVEIFIFYTRFAAGSVWSKQVGGKPVVGSIITALRNVPILNWTVSRRSDLLHYSVLEPVCGRFCRTTSGSVVGPVKLYRSRDDRCYLLWRSCFVFVFRRIEFSVF